MATLKDHAAQLPTQKEEQPPDHKQRTIEDDQVIASIAKRIEMGEQLVTGISCLVRAPAVGVMEILEPVVSPVAMMKLMIGIDLVFSIGHCFLTA